MENTQRKTARFVVLVCVPRFDAETMTYYHDWTAEPRLLDSARKARDEVAEWNYLGYAARFVEVFK